MENMNNNPPKGISNSFKLSAIIELITKIISAFFILFLN